MGDAYGTGSGEIRAPRGSEAAPDVTDLTRRLLERRDEYQRAEPFPHLVIDDVFQDSLASAASAEFPPPGSPGWKNYVHVNERKYGDTKPDTWGPSLRAITVALTSPAFCAALEETTGIPGLLPDWTMDGGGLHQSMRGGFLNLHADFTAHHSQPTWRRRVNLLLYLNDTWDESWGGSLQLWTRDLSRCVEEVVPRGNRMVIFSTDEDSFHGHPEPMRCPEGVARRSLALYYFTDEAAPVVRSTLYRPRPGDSRGRAAAIALDTFVLRMYDKVKRRFDWSDDVGVSGMLGRLGRLTSRRGRPR